MSTENLKHDLNQSLKVIEVAIEMLQGDFHLHDLDMSAKEFIKKTRQDNELED